MDEYINSVIADYLRLMTLEVPKPRPKSGK